jgi:hypothetical protein
VFTYVGDEKMKYNVKTVDGGLYKVECDWLDIDNPRWVAFMNAAKEVGKLQKTVAIFTVEDVVSVTME